MPFSFNHVAHSFPPEKPAGGVVYLTIFLLFLFPVIGFGQSADNFDEVSVIMNVQRIGSTEIPIIIKGNSTYLPVKDIFDFLKIKCYASGDLETIEGTFINADANFLIDKNNNRIEYQERIIHLADNDFFKTDDNLFLKIEYFGSVFGLDCQFNFRSLSVMMTTKIELPAIKEMQEELLRQNLRKLKGEKNADTVIARRFPLFRLGIADWAVFSSQQTGTAGNVRVNLGLGGIVAGGEASIFLAMNAHQPVRLADQYFKWRYVNNDWKGIRQIMVGTVSTQSISSIYAPIAGIQITNSPTTFRKSFGSYTISDKTEPGWTVELYVNNVLVDFVKADASGFFKFDVPLIYGNSAVKLRYYGPYGEERISERNINIPFNFMPRNHLEYSLTSAIIRDAEKNKFVRFNMNYGLSRRITIGAGFEKLTNANSGKPFSFINTSIRLGSHVLFSGEHAFGVVSKGLLTCQLPSQIRLEIDYSKYEKGQNTIRTGKESTSNFLEERKVILSVPFHHKRFSAFSRFTFNQLVLPALKYNSSELLLSAIIRNVSTNLTTTMTYTDPAQKLISSNLSSTIKVARYFRITPLVQYNFTQKGLVRVRGEIEKSFSNKGFLNFSYERDMARNLDFYSVGFRYSFSFAQVSFFGRHNQNSTSTSEVVNGSLLYNTHSKKLLGFNQNNVGRAGLVISPFLDINCNGTRDKNEPKVADLNLKINAGRTTRNNQDTTILVTGLEAYNSYFIEIDKNSFDNISWQVKNAKIKVVTEPNHFKLIEVPVAVMGEVSGKVMVNTPLGKKATARLIVNIYCCNGQKVTRLLTESDGFFNFIGLPPGNYYAVMDEDQLKKLHISGAGKMIPFSIRESREGDVYDQLDFELTANGAFNNE